MTFQQDSLGIYQEVYPEPDRVSPLLKRQLNDFLAMWLNNIRKQGFAPKEEANKRPKYRSDPRHGIVREIGRDGRPATVEE